MATTVESEWLRKLRTVGGAVLGLAVIVYVIAKGSSTLADAIAPGVWGYLGAMGFFAVVGPLPLVLMSVRLLGRGAGLVMLAGALSISVASLGGQRHWPGWAMPGWLAAMPLGYLAVRAILSLPAQLTRQRAAKLLRRQRGGNAWSLADWEWAFTQLGGRDRAD